MVDEPLDPVDPALADEVRTAFAQYCARLGLGAATGDALDPSTDPATSSALDDPMLLSYVVTGSMLLHLAERQALLAAADATTRLRRALGLLLRERTLWSVAPSVPAVDLARLPADPR